MTNHEEVCVEVTEVIITKTSRTPVRRSRKAMFDCKVELQLEFLKRSKSNKKVCQKSFLAEVDMYVDNLMKSTILIGHQFHECQH